MTTAQTHIIVGGTRGPGGTISLGLATARLLRERGDQVIVLGNVAAEVDDVCHEGFDGRVCDITNGALVDETFKRIFADYGTVTGIVQAVSIWCGGPFLEVPRDKLRQVVEANVLGPMYVTQTALAHLVEQGWGNYVSIGAAAVLQPHPGIPVYTATKTAMSTLVRCLAPTLGPQGIKVMWLNPGPMRTSLQQRQGGEFLDEVFCEPEDVAPYVAQLMSLRPEDPMIQFELVHHADTPKERYY